MTTPDAPPFIRSLTTPPGQPVVIKPTHVTRDTDGGYHVVSGVGRQASTAGAPR